MVHEFTGNPAGPNPYGLPPVRLAWDDEKDTYALTIGEDSLPALSGIQIASLYLCLHHLQIQGEPNEDAPADAASPAGPRDEQTGSPVPTG